MTTKCVALWIAVGMLSSVAMVAQQRHPVDPQIVAAMREVSAAHLKANIEKLASFRTRHTLSSPDPASNEIGAARAWIKSEFERYSQACGGCLEVKLSSFPQAPASRIPQPTEIVNVYAVLRGSRADNASRMYVVSGHYDSRALDVMDPHAHAPGANDDASGVAVVLEAARVLSRQRFPATLIFLAVAGEEQGLNGSQHFARTAREQGWNIEAVLSDDTVGGDRSPGQDPAVLRVFSEGIPSSATAEQLRLIRSTGAENDAPSRQLARYIREIGRQYLGEALVPGMVFRPDRYLRGGDHTAFNEQGFAAVRLTEFRENYDHQHQNPHTQNGIEYGDLPRFLDYEYVANVTRLNVATLASLAAAPAPPVDVRLETRELVNDSTLLWQPSPGGLATGYELLSRPTTSAEWEKAESVGNVTRATDKRSKDNVVFAVRAVDTQGHRSLPVVPTPQR